MHLFQFADYAGRFADGGPIAFGGRRVSHPFIIWTMQRTGGTSLAELLMAMSEHKSADHEPFNWRRHKPRQFGHIAQHWAETKDEVELKRALSAIFADRYLIKHCYELHGTPFNSRLVEMAARTDYCHILLLRRDELSRLLSKFIAEAHGTWFKDYAAQVFGGVLAKERTIRPLPADRMVRHFSYCQEVTEQTRELLDRFNLEVKDIHYEDLYLGEQANRQSHLSSLFDFIGFAPETIERHRAEIEEKIFDSGQKTTDVLPFVPNLEQVKQVLAEAGCRAGAEPEAAIGRHPPVPREPNHQTEPRIDMGQTPEHPGTPAPIFTCESGFSPENRLGYRGKQLNRLNARYRTFILPNAERIKGKRVLDLGSHDGHWSLACLMSGAAHVTAVEIRGDLIEKARGIIDATMMERIRFIHGDIFDVLPQLAAQRERFDIVLCLGIFYLILDHHYLVQLTDAFHPELILIDTNLIDSDDAFIKLKAGTDDGSSPSPARKFSLSGVASRGALAVLAAKFGYKDRYELWDDRLENRDGLHDYYATNKLGARRYTLYLEPL
jgi:methyltransferase family protein